MSLWIPVYVVPLLLAGVLLYFGRRRRVGTDPHCRRCNYLLHGIESERCPECGGMLSQGAIVRGEPRRRWGLLIFGWLVVLLVGSLWVTDAIIRLQGVNWYQYEPTHYVLRDLNSNQIATAQRAWTELVRRDAAGSLSAQTRDQLVRFALARQGNARVPYNSLDMDAVNYLGNRAVANDLTPDEKTKFFEQTMQLRLVVRPKVILGDAVPYVAYQDGMGPNIGNFWARLSMHGAGIDGKVVQREGGSSSSGFGPGSFGSYLKCRTAGKHEISVTFRIEIFSGPFDLPGSIPLYQSDRTLTGNFEVVTMKPGDLVQPIFDPKLAATVKSVIVPQSFHFNARNGNSFEGNILFVGAPVNFAFDVYVRYGGRDQRLGAVTCSARGGVFSNGDFVSGKGKPPVPAMVDIILRPSEQAARDTVDQYRFWNQELVYPNVPVAQP
jgi:hypothetical protein